MPVAKQDAHPGGFSFYDEHILKEKSGECIPGMRKLRKGYPATAGFGSTYEVIQQAGWKTFQAFGICDL